MKFLYSIFFLLLSLKVFAADEWLAARTFYRTHGYLWIKNFYSPAQVQLIQKWGDQLQKDAEYDLENGVTDHLIIVPEKNQPDQVCRVEDILTLYPDIYHFARGTLLPYLNTLLEEPYVFFKDKLNFKWPKGGAFSHHQDFPAFDPFGPREHVTAMICIDPANLENGCLHVAKDWKRDLEIEDERTVLPYIEGGEKHGSIVPEICKKLEWLPLIASPGDLVLISSYVPHFSEKNESTSSRRALFITLNRLIEGNFRKTYYHAKREDPENPVFHLATPTHARTK